MVTDVYSKAPFVRYVPNTGAAATIKAMKSIFTENGIPVKVVSDNGPHFAATEYKHFANRWGFSFILSSPEYPRGHALIERHVQTIKKCMHKCDRGGFDFDLALLVLRSTPLSSDLPSPAELLQQRRFRTTLPVHVSDPTMSDSVRRKLQKRQDDAAARYDAHTREKADIEVGQNVRLYNADTKLLEPAVVTGLASTPRSYFVQRVGGGKELRRNRIHLKPTIEVWDSRVSRHDVADDVDIPDVPTEESIEDAAPRPVSIVQAPRTAEPSQPHPTNNEQMLRRSSRTRVRPDFLGMPKK